MPTVRFQPSGKKINVRSGTTVLQAARKARVFISTRCGGNAGCLMCKTRIVSSGCSSVTDKEAYKLGEHNVNCGYRLSCQAKVLSDVTVEVPEDRLKAAIRKKLEEQSRENNDSYIQRNNDDKN